MNLSFLLTVLLTYLCYLTVLVVSKNLSLNQKHLNWLGSRDRYRKEDDARSRTELREVDILKHIYTNGRQNPWTSSTSFIVGLFNKLQKGEKLARASGHQWTSAELQHSDTVRCFSAKGNTQPNGKDKRFHFKVPYLPKHERVRLAELRFFESKRRKTKARKIKINIVKSNTVIKKVTSRITPEQDNIYHVYDITRMISPWVNGNNGNITVDVWIRNAARKSHRIKAKDDALLVLYSEDKGFMKSIYKSFTSDELLDQSNAKIRRKRNVQRRRMNKWKLRKDEHCSAYDFRVDFNLIGWGQWIIYPKTFNAKVCYGRCPSPAGLELNPSNHAMLQILMRLKRKRVAPMPCCAPKKLRPMSMLYFEYDDIVVRHHEDMVVDECGCS